MSFIGAAGGVGFQGLRGVGSRILRLEFSGFSSSHGARPPLRSRSIAAAIAAFGMSWLGSGFGVSRGFGVLALLVVGV